MRAFQSALCALLGSWFVHFVSVVSVVSGLPPSSPVEIQYHLPSSTLNEQLLQAAQEGNLEKCKKALDAGADPNTVEPGLKQTPLHWAAQRARPQLAQLLLERGASLRAVDRDRQTALHVAASCLHVARKSACLHVAKIMLQFANQTSMRRDAKDALMRTPLHRVCTWPNKEDTPIVLAFVQLLVNVAGSSVQSADYSGWTPLHAAAQQGHLAAVQFLVERGARVNAMTEYYTRPIHVAAQGGSVEVVRLLADHGAIVHPVTALLIPSPLHLATYYEHSRVVEYLLQHPAAGNATSVNLADPDGYTALHMAAFQGNVPLCQQLVRAGAKLNLLAKNQKTPLDVAEEFHRESSHVVQYLRNLGARRGRGYGHGGNVGGLVV